MIVKEVCVDNIYDALSAVKKGANRLELCSDLEQDGLTPSYELLIEDLEKLEKSLEERNHKKTMRLLKKLIPEWEPSEEVKIDS